MRKEFPFKQPYLYFFNSKENVFNLTTSINMATSRIIIDPFGLLGKHARTLNIQRFFSAVKIENFTRKK